MNSLLTVDLSTLEMLCIVNPSVCANQTIVKLLMVISHSFCWLPKVVCVKYYLVVLLVIQYYTITVEKLELPLFLNDMKKNISNHNKHCRT